MKEKNSDKNNSDVVTELVETGSEISGSVVGAVIGTIIAGPLGGVVGAASSPIIAKILKKVGTEIRQRYISPREEVRIGAVYGFALHQLQENLNSGKKLREDSFFEEHSGSRMDSEEVFEGVLLGAQKEYEERKVKFIGNLYANICTNDKVSREHANQLIKTTNNISYRQLCIIQLLVEKWIESQKLNFKVKWDIPKIDKGDIIIEIRDLQQKGLVNTVWRWNDIDDNSKPLETDDVNITEAGLFYSEILSLDQIPKEDLEKFNKEMKTVE